MKITQLQKVTIPVKDQAVAKEFYATKLGFEVRAEFPVPMGENSRWIEVGPKDGQTTFILCNWFPNLAPIQAAMLHTADFDSDVSELKKAGVEVGDPQETPWGKQASFSDPDGNSFVLTDAAPQS